MLSENIQLQHSERLKKKKNPIPKENEHKI